MKLNLGCGRDIKQKWENLDIKPLKGAIKHDLNTGLNYSDNSVSEIYARMILEHVDNPVRLIQECQRVLNKGGTLTIEVPYYNSNSAFSIFHKSFFNHNWYNKFVYDYNIYTGKERTGTQSKGFRLFNLISVKYLPTKRAKWIPEAIRRFISPMVGEITNSTVVVLRK